MKITEFLKLKKSPLELNFLDLNIYEDKNLFVDYALIKDNSDDFSKNCQKTVNSFIEIVKTNLKDKKEDEIRNLFREMKESNEVCLGFSSGHPRGRGLANDCAQKISEFVIKEKIYNNEMLSEIFCIFSDSKIFIEGIGNDRTSDAIISLIKEHLIDYTNEQCQLFNTKIKKIKKKFKLWNRNKSTWEEKEKIVPQIDEKDIIFIPRGIVNVGNKNIQRKYYSQGVIEKLQKEYLIEKSHLCIKKADGSLKVPTKKSLMKKIPGDKKTLFEITKKKPEILIDFKNKKNIVKSLNRIDLLYILDESNNIKDIIQGLRNKLKYFKNDLEGICQLRGILEFLFFDYIGNRRIFSLGTNYRNYKKWNIIFDNEIHFRYINNETELDGYISTINTPIIIIVKKETQLIKEKIRNIYKKNIKVILLSFIELDNLLLELHDYDSIDIENFLKQKLN